jgi:ketosteroid isomerase-like protein
MPERANAEETTLIKALLEGWADAVRRHDLPAILAHHDREMVMFDLPPPLQCRGVEAYAQTWDLFFRYHKPVFSGSLWDCAKSMATGALRTSITQCPLQTDSAS